MNHRRFWKGRIIISVAPMLGLFSSAMVAGCGSVSLLPSDSSEGGSVADMGTRPPAPPSFGSPRHIPVGAGKGTIVAGDWNGDGKIDLALCSAGVAKLQTLLGNGDGTFVLIKDSAPICDTRLTPARINGDAHWDIVSGSANGADVLLSDGDGTFRWAATLTTQDRNLDHAHAVLDFDHDGNLDVITTKYRGDGDNVDSSLQLFKGDGDGTFQSGTPADLMIPGESVYTLPNIDVGIDPQFGMVSTHVGFTGGYYLQWWHGSMPSAAGDTGEKIGQTFSPFRPIYPTLAGKPEGVAFVGHFPSNESLIWRGAYDRQVPSTVNLVTVSFVQAADFNHDGKLDYVIVGGDADNRILFYLCGPIDCPESFIPDPDGAWSVAVADFDKDGALDLALVNAKHDQVDVLMGK